MSCKLLVNSTSGLFSLLLFFFFLGEEPPGNTGLDKAEGQPLWKERTLGSGTLLSVLGENLRSSFGPSRLASAGPFDLTSYPSLLPLWPPRVRFLSCSQGPEHSFLRPLHDWLFHSVRVGARLLPHQALPDPHPHPSSVRQIRLLLHST